MRVEKVILTCDRCGADNDGGGVYIRESDSFAVLGMTESDPFYVYYVDCKIQRRLKRDGSAEPKDTHLCYSCWREILPDGEATKNFRRKKREVGSHA